MRICASQVCWTFLKADVCLILVRNRNMSFDGFFSLNYKISFWKSLSAASQNEHKYDENFEGNASSHKGKFPTPSVWVTNCG